MKDLKESYEYRLVKQLTAKENRKAVKDTIKRGLLFITFCILGLHAFLNGFLFNFEKSIILWTSGSNP